MNAERLDSYTYKVKAGNRLVYIGITNDVERERHYHRYRWPNAKIEVVGGPMTRRAAMAWARGQSKRHPSIVLGGQAPFSNHSSAA